MKVTDLVVPGAMGLLPDWIWALKRTVPVVDWVLTSAQLWGTEGLMLWKLTVTCWLTVRVMVGPGLVMLPELVPKP